ncbi:MBL fold metallo-hydrolase [Parvularcula oceani]|uniref:MBL fold metallo-hydrolase n=1 Tax=Parvularcula oceani TaxID=1247963 RepID=UPI0004E23D02|nr:MBL fold metallo-hydrolase [Parvularcula oceani]
MKLRAVILGSGSSGGVPRIGGADGRGNWGECDPQEPKNRRTRCSILVQRACEERGWNAEALTTVLIDTAPELRLQLTSVGCGRVDAVFFTHDHADQTHGIDDLRALALNTGKRVPVHVDPLTCPDLMDRFAYCFEQAQDSPYPAILDARRMPAPGETVEVDGPTGPVPVTPFLQEHGTVPSLGFRTGPISYSSDLNDLPPESFEIVAGSEVWILDALRYRPHPSHVHLGRALDWLERLRIPRGVLTNLHVDMDYRTVAEETPEGVEPAYDGMIVEA